MARFVVFLAVFASITSPVLADIPPPPPEKGFKRVPFENVLKLETEMPDYKFYAFQRRGLSGKETLGEELKLGTTTGVPVPSSSSPSVRTGIVAVPKKVMDELKTTENLAKLLYRDFEGKLPAGVVVHETYGVISDIKSSDPRTKVENVITASEDKKAGVKFSEKETPAPKDKSTAPTPSSREPLSTLIASVALGLAIATLCFWVARRRVMSQAKSVAVVRTTS